MTRTLPYCGGAASAAHSPKGLPSTTNAVQLWYYIVGGGTALHGSNQYSFCGAIACRVQHKMVMWPLTQCADLLGPMANNNKRLYSSRAAMFHDGVSFRAHQYMWAQTNAAPLQYLQNRWNR